MYVEGTAEKLVGGGLPPSWIGLSVTVEAYLFVTDFRYHI